MATKNEVDVGLSGASGTGSFAGTNSPIFVTPTLGAATATTINKLTFTAPGTAATLTIANNKTLTVNNSVTFSGTDSSSIAFGAGGTLAYTSAFTTWTPVFDFASHGDLSVSYATQFGAYVTVGNLYIVTLNLICTPTFTTSTGNLIITGLPVASNSTAGNIAVGSVWTSGMVWPASYTSLALEVTAGSQLVNLIASKTAAAATLFGSTNFLSGSAITIVGTICYLI